VTISLNLFAGTLAHLSPQLSLDLSSTSSGGCVYALASPLTSLPGSSLPLETPASALGYFGGLPHRLNVGGPDIALHLPEGRSEETSIVLTALTRLLTNWEAPEEPRMQGKIAEDVRKNRGFVRSQLTDPKRKNREVSFFAGTDLTLHRLVIRESGQEVLAWGDLPPASEAKVVEVLWSLRGAPKRAGSRTPLSPPVVRKEEFDPQTIKYYGELKTTLQRRDINSEIHVRLQGLFDAICDPLSALSFSQREYAARTLYQIIRILPECAEQDALTVIDLLDNALKPKASTTIKEAYQALGKIERKPSKKPAMSDVLASANVRKLSDDLIRDAVADLKRNVSELLQGKGRHRNLKKAAALMVEFAEQQHHKMEAGDLVEIVRNLRRISWEQGLRQANVADVMAVHGFHRRFSALWKAPTHYPLDAFQKFFIERHTRSEESDPVLATRPTETISETQVLVTQTAQELPTARHQNTVISAAQSQEEIRETNTEAIQQLDLNLQANKASQPPPTLEIETQPTDTVELPKNVVELLELTGVVGLSAESVFKYLHATPAQKYQMVPPTIREFEEVRDCLKDIMQPEECVGLAKESIALIDDALGQSVSASLLINKTATANYGYLSVSAQEGFYLCSLKLDTTEHLIHLLEHPSLTLVEIDAVLSLMTLLHDSGVRGYEKILSELNRPDGHAIRGFFNELTAAMAYAQSEVVKKVTMAREYAVQRSSLTPEEAKAFPQGQETIAVDLVCELENRQRLVEVKSSLSQVMRYDVAAWEVCEKQARRLAAVVRLQKMEGLEYSIHARDIDSRLLDRLEKVLNESGVSYAISVHHEEREENIVRSSPGFLPLPVHRTIPSERIRPLPPDPGPKVEKPKSTPPAPRPKSDPPQEKREGIWSKEIVSFLNRFILEQPKKLPGKANRTDAQKSLKNNFRSGAQRNTYDALGGWLQGANLDGKSRERIAQLLAVLRSGITEVISDRKFSILVEIASIAIGIPSTQADDSISLEQIRKSSQAIMHWFDSATEEIQERQSLIQDKELPIEERRSLAQEETNFTPDLAMFGVPLVLTPNMLSALLPENNGDRTLNAVREHWQRYDAAYREFLKSKESL